ncbi:MAG: hypothetical protein ACWA5W_06555 [Phycisphaerales bacterium]
MSEITQSLANDPALLIPIISVGGGLIMVIIAIIFSMSKQIAITKEREKSRREIAAYIAEGSMTPEDGAKLMGASPDKVG